MSNKKILIKGISFSYIYIFVYLFTGILTTPLLLNYFGTEYFALLMLVYTIITYLNNIRFGIPESLAALVAKSSDIELNINIIKKSFLLLIYLLFITLSIFIILNLFISDWRVFLGYVYSLDKDNVLNIFYILIIFALIKIPLDLSLSVFIGFNEVYLEKIYKVVNLLLNFTLVVFVINTTKSIVFFVLWAGILDLLVSLLAYIHAVIKYKIYNKEIKKIQVKSSYLLKNGVLFFQLSFIQTILWGAGIILVSHILTLNDVAIYSLSMKIYVYIFYVFIIINTVLAPLYGKFYASNDWDNINKLFSLVIKILPLFGGIIWITTLYFMSDVIHLWTGSSDFYIGPIFVFFMGMFFYFTAYVNSYITLLYSIGEVKNILFIRWIEVLVNLILSIVGIYLLGLSGVAIAMSLALIFVSTQKLPMHIKEKTNDKINLNFIMQKKHFIYVLIPSIVIAFLASIYIELLLFKVFIFILMILFYLYFSWNMLASIDKNNIMLFLKFKKG